MGQESKESLIIYTPAHMCGRKEELKKKAGGFFYLARS